MSQQIYNQLKYFSPISLKEMEQSMLMNRVDTKYCFNLNLLNKVLDQVKDHYTVMTINDCQLFNYNTLYFDTEDFLFYRQHHNGIRHRHKVRHRTYVESNLGFLEVKEKNNKGRTNKERIKLADAPMEWDNKSLNFLNDRIPIDTQSIIPNVNIQYQRMTLVNKHCPERVTIDLGLQFDYKGSHIEMTNLVIAEIKQDSLKYSPFIYQMREERVRQGSISKYCLGVALTNEHIKKNNFKPAIHRLTKIAN